MKVFVFLFGKVIKCYFHSQVLKKLCLQTHKQTELFLSSLVNKPLAYLNEWDTGKVFYCAHL